MSQIWHWMQLQGFVGWSLIAGGAVLLLFMSLKRMHCVDHVRHLVLWHRAARIAGLNRRDRVMLMDLARQTGMRNPASLVLGKGCFQQAVEIYLAQNGGGRAPQLAALERSLFLPEGSPLVVLESSQNESPPPRQQRRNSNPAAPVRKLSTARV
ncbi:MAG TPA: hypothetical protein VG711_02255 [Phycisphaerales bacterium]|nr:hypothetical protein [Phycisphaerales bacterium]